MATFSDANTKVVEKITCRVESAFGIGTGVLLVANGGEWLYLITAKHCLLGKDLGGKADSSAVDIAVASDTSGILHSVANEDIVRILVSPSLDAALVVLRASAFAECPQIAVALTQNPNRDCIFRGFPQAYSAEEGVSIAGVYTESNIVTTNTPLGTVDSDPHYNCEGFSGSGVFCESNGRLFLTGIIYEFSEAFQRFRVHDLGFVKTLLSENNLPGVAASPLPKTDSLARDAVELAVRTERTLNGINVSFADGFTLDRVWIDSDLSQKFEEKGLILLAGEAGAGKSAYAKSLMLRLRNQNYRLLAFRAETFAKATIGDALPYLENDLLECLRQFANESPVIVLIDNLEKLLEASTFDAAKELLVIFKQFKDIKVLVTCRSYAYQQLIFELYHSFPKYALVEVPLLSDTELSTIETHFPTLNGLLQQRRIKDTLRRPFYLSLVILHSEILSPGEDVSEREFRRLVWSEIISKRNRARGQLFETIALQRAVSMSLYVEISADPILVRQLLSDGILVADETLGDRYSPSHDMYEDIALVRFVERAYQSRDGVLDFFHRLGGTELAKRRAFRLWLNDQLFETTTDLEQFVSGVLSETRLEQYWQDETIVAILRSEYIQQFIDNNQELLTRNTGALLIKSIHLLRTACQEPGERLPVDQDDSLYQPMYLTPVGPGWSALLSYASSKISELKAHWRLILTVAATDWPNKLHPNDALPPEAKNVAEVLLAILNEARNDYSSHSDSYSKDDIDNAVQVLFRLCAIVPAEVQGLIQTADSFDRRKDKSYQRRDFYLMVLDLCLSGIYNHEVCRILPDVVCKAAVSHWLKSTADLQRDWYMPSFDIEDDFGLEHHGVRSYFPAGIYKTPIRFLLHFHPLKALELIVSMVNHATRSYAGSRRGQGSGVAEVHLRLNDGSTTHQFGNEVIWGMYRGTVEVTPYLLQSILMSLESWLLELCGSNSDWAADYIKFTYDYLLKNSESVATTAVLASVALAHPDRIGKSCFPILTVREFFSWDIHRLMGDQRALAPADEHVPTAQDERLKSNRLKHRAYRLENLVTILQAGQYSQEMSRLIDEFQRSANADDVNWRLALNSMDFRKYRIDESVAPREKNQIALSPKIDDDLSRVVEEAQASMKRLAKAASMSNWAYKVYTNVPNVEKSAERWGQEYQIYIEGMTSGDEAVHLFGQPSYLAAIGIKFFASRLSHHELNWCADYVLRALLDCLAKAEAGNPSFSAGPIEPIVQVAPLLLGLQVSHPRRKSIKKAIFRALLHMTGFDEERILDAVRTDLWTIDETFATSCLAGMVEYASYHAQVGYAPPDSEAAELLHRQESRLVPKVLANKIALSTDALSFEMYSHWYLRFATQIIPYDSTKTTNRSYVKQVVFLMFDLLNSSDGQKEHGASSGYFDTEQQLQLYTAAFLLSQPIESSQALFAELLDRVFVRRGGEISHDALDYIEGIVEQLIIQQDALNSGNFWPLWQILYERIKSTQQPHFISQLFLARKFSQTGADDWPPVREGKLLLQNSIQELGHFDIESVLRLLSGVGLRQLMPQGLMWLQTALLGTDDLLEELRDSNSFFYCEKLLRRAYQRYLPGIKASKQLKGSLIFLLDKMITLDSSLAYVVRERIISV